MRYRRRMRLASVFAILVLAGCAAPERRAAAACRNVRFEGDVFTICAARPGRHHIVLLDRGTDGRPIRDFAPLAPQASSIAFAMNAGMFDAEGLPIGLYVERGRALNPLNRAEGPGNFHLKPNGVFYGDATGWHVATTDAYAAAAPRPRFATQSGPMLVIHGALHPAFDPDGASRYVRNGLKTPDALFLDGYVSRLWDPPAGRMDPGPKIGPIVVVTENR